MPTYDYKCSACKSTFTSIRKIADRKTPTKEPCPICDESGHITQMITAVAYAGEKLKQDGGFKDVMSKIVDKHPLHNMDD